MRLRTVVFWLHLSCGVAAGAVILIMSTTGVLLTYQRQITAWADMRGYRHEPSVGAERLPADELVARLAAAHPEVTPTALVIRSDRNAPASFAVGAGKQMFVDAYSGAVLGEGSGQGVRDFFRVVVEWHRYIAMAGDRRPTGKAITGAANLIFLFIVMSGLYLWWPRTRTWAAVRNVVWFRGGIAGKARDFNWHNTIGFWSAVPLAIIVAGAVVISYPWATALVYRAYGEQPPTPAGNAVARTGSAHQRADDSAGARLEAHVVKARTYMSEWRTISIALPPADSPRVVLTVDAGDGGQPHKRAALTLNRRTGEVERWEPYSSQSAGRRARTWLRFAHTGEVYGVIGQTVAGTATAGAVVLVWTGIALALRRFLTTRKRNRDTMPRAA